MNAIPLSKRRPCVKKLLCKRLKNNFYEKKNKNISDPFKKVFNFKVQFTSYLKTRYFSETHFAKDKEYFRLTKALVAIIFS